MSENEDVKVTMSVKYIHYMYWIIIAIVVAIFLWIIFGADTDNGVDKHDIEIAKAEERIKNLENEVDEKDSLLVIKDANIARLDSAIANGGETTVINVINPKYDKERVTVLDLSDDESIGYLSNRLNGK